MSSTRTAMRLLSPRIQCLQRKPISHTQLRLASSRYSNPVKRSFNGAPALAPSFVGGSTATHDALAIVPNAPPPSGLDAVADRMAWEEKRAHALRRMRFAGMGLLLSLFGMAVLLYNLDLDDLEKAEKEKRQRMTGTQQLDASNDTNAKFQGKEVHVIGAGDGKRIVAQGQGVEIDLVETGTSSVPHFPRTIYLPKDGSEQSAGAAPNTPANPGNEDNQEQYTLLGLGIRTVSFLSIQVYVVGMYIRTQDLSVLQETLIHNINETASTLILSEKEELKKRLLDPVASREIWMELLKVPGVKTAWRVTPTRNTDYGHLRDGWITGINNRIREFKQVAQGAETEYEAEDFGKSIGEFKNIFAGGKAPKGSVMILSRQRNGSLDVWFQQKPDGTPEEQAMQKLGHVADERIGKLIWLGYLAGEKVSSEAARKGVADGCVSFASRPTGSAETMIR
ncbi:unnamed protein product [Zymoseptoria tritici ST99CH_3D1]|uniref:Chalcone isomerase domain-containing protein n=1 Tax=Zymoseptoria tritici (strain ST99CH_3D7) TaxID=1276538 RepID=A0A1X7RES4_ZYMT9|nr:unnamed protein product [Zymoseptoria tritici ST99CH_3D7]SMR44420.1 unnamed protein product [Zymoseptoria tritici ST99CH_3D1]